MRMQGAAEPAAGSHTFHHVGLKIAAAKHAVRLLVLSPLLSGCISTAPPLLGADPADPHARVAQVGYRSTVAPYVSLRPAAPTGWQDQNRRVAPAPTSER